MADGVTAPGTTSERFPPVFWTANVTELFERAAYYSMASFVVIYLGQLGLGAYWPSNLNSVLWTLVYFLPILSGTIADQVGFRKSLLVAFVLLAAGYLLMGYPGLVRRRRPSPRSSTRSSPPRRGSSARSSLAILLIGVGGSVIKPCISGTVQKTAGALRHARLRDLLHDHQHRLAVRPRHGVRRPHARRASSIILTVVGICAAAAAALISSCAGTSPTARRRGRSG